MKKLIFLLLAFAAGYFTSNYLYTKAFDPMEFLITSNSLAANSYLSGCLEAKMDRNRYISNGDINTCKNKAKDLHDILEKLRNDPGHNDVVR